jgi:Kdo2-lipid IVA lauroyltransferase/acyltransferase
MSSIKYLIVYLFFRVLLFPFQLLPYQLLKWKAWCIGSLGYFVFPHYRKRAENNLAFAKTLNVSKDVIRQSFINLVMTVMEYGYFYRNPKRIKKRIKIFNRGPIEEFVNKGCPVVYYSGHQANWELSIFPTSSLYKNKETQFIVVGRPIRNHYLYDWISNFREYYGACLITPKQLFKKGISILKQGGGVGIVGDQALPESLYSFPFFGTRAWTTSSPALLAYKIKGPIVCVFTHRSSKGLEVVYSNPIYPDYSLKLKEGVPKLMDQCMTLMQEDIRNYPGEWLWLHNRWKQKRSLHVPRCCRADSILILLPKGCEEWLSTFFTAFRRLYPYALSTLLVPYGEKISSLDAEIIYYSNLQERCFKNQTFQLIFDFLECKKTQKYYLKQHVKTIVTLKHLSKWANKRRPSNDFKQSPTELFLGALGGDEDLL